MNGNVLLIATLVLSPVIAGERKLRAYANSSQSTVKVTNGSTGEVVNVGVARTSDVVLTKYGHN